MEQFLINVAHAKLQIEKIRTFSSQMDSYFQSVSDEKDKISLGVHTDEVKKSIQNIMDIISENKKNFGDFGDELEQIINCYIQTEEAIVASEEVVESINENATDKSDPTEQTSDQSESLEKPFDIDVWLAEHTGVSEEVIDMIKFVLGFIPVVNVGTDIYQLADDIIKAWGDDKHISAGEMAGIVTDIVFLGLDVVAAGTIIKGAVKAVKTAKVAKTSAKVASEAAQMAAKQAEKATVRTGGTVPTTKAAQKAVKTAKNAERTAEKAKKAAITASKAKKDAAKKIGNDVKDTLIDNIRNEYIPNADNQYRSTFVLREGRDGMIENY